jgi:hypothetical protein
MKKIIGSTLCWNQKFNVIELESEKLKNHYIGKKIKWAWAHDPEVIKENEIINVGLMEGTSDHYLIEVKANKQDQIAHEKIRVEMKKHLGTDLAEQKQPWLMWATYNKNLYSTFEIV